MCDARSHPVCRKKYTADPNYWKKKDAENIEMSYALETAHSKAFVSVIDYTANLIISSYAALTPVSHMCQ